MKMNKMLASLIAVCCLAPAAAFAGQQHPLVSDTAEVVAPSKFEAETAVEYHSSDAYSAFVIQETVTGGIIPKLDAFIALPFTSYKPDFPGASRESGLGDITIGAKYNFMNIEKTALSVKPFIVLPVGDDKKGLGYGGVGLGANLIATLELDKKISFDGNLMLQYQDTSGDSFNEFGAAVAGKFQATNELKAVAEIALSKTDQTGSKTDAFLTAGAIFAAQKNLDVDCGVRLGLSDTAEDFALLVGATYKF